MQPSARCAGKLLFEGLGDAEPFPRDQHEQQASSLQQTEKAAELLRVFSTIDDASVRSKLIELLEAFGGQNRRKPG